MKILCVYLRRLKLIRIGIGYRTGSFISEIVFGTVVKFELNLKSFSMKKEKREIMDIRISKDISFGRVSICIEDGWLIMVSKVADEDGK